MVVVAAVVSACKQINLRRAIIRGVESTEDNGSEREKMEEGA